ncbi:Inorganic phosphate transporter PHO84 [Fonsecaea pedrosoi]|nr:Inorganic phosphate transporter PHO84 [Fonsecaea pedrosoi]
MGRWRGRLYATDRARDFDHERDRHVRVRQIYETIDRQPFQWVVVLVAGVGFLLDGFSLFAGNIALPMISYVYWKEEVSSYRVTCINIVTLAGTLVGQATFGFLADKKGRKTMYGIELLLLIASTLGVVMSSEGYNGSMSVFAWLIWWRIMVGIGVGADYPLSAVITAEFAPTRHRARMMASVFFMQPLGQIMGNLISLIVVAISRRSNNDDLQRSVDIMWRWIIGIGVVPGVVALIFRFAIPETPRFLLDIEDDPVKAEFDATQLFGETSMNNELEIGMWCDSLEESNLSNRSFDERSDARPSYTVTPAPLATLNSSWKISKADIKQYFWTEGNWRTLMAVSMCWLLLDFGYYGIGLSNPQFLAKTWGSLHIANPQPIWKTNDDPSTDIYDMFMNTSVQALVVLNTGSFAGGILWILSASRLNRVSLQKYGFLALAALFIALGTEFIVVQEEGALAITLYVIGQFLFNFVWILVTGRQPDEALWDDPSGLQRVYDLGGGGHAFLDTRGARKGETRLNLVRTK